MAKREVPTNTNDWNRGKPAEPLEAQSWPEATVRETSFTRRPETPIQALLETSPFEEPETSIEEIQPIREVIATAIERLPARLRFVINAIHVERLSFAQLAERMSISKTHAFRLERQAEEVLRNILSQNQIIRERLNLETAHKSWWGAAASHLARFAPTGMLDDGELYEGISELLYEMRDNYQADETSYLESVDLIGTCAAEWLNNRGKWNVSDIADLLESKQLDYGHGNIAAFGHLGIAVRLSDKVERMKNLQGSTTPRNETFADTMLDIVGYCTIAMMLEDGSFYMEVNP